jgi:NAD(P)H dehydrogenase (quinone)
MTEPSILVTAANGRIGSRVVQQLLEIGRPVKAFVRDAASAAKRFSEGVEVVQGDLGDAASVKRAMTNVDRVLLISPVDPDQVRMQGNVVDAAIEIGAGIVKLSGLATFADSYVDSGRWHAETERAISLSGLPHVFLHPLFFMQNLAFTVDQAMKTGIIRSAVGDASIAMIHADDIATTATHSLLELHTLTGRTLTLTEETSHNYHEIAAMLSEQFGKQVEYQPLDDQTLAANLKKAGQPEWHVQLLLQFNQAFREGLGDQPSTVVREILGRSALSLTQYLADEIEQAETGGSNPFPS